MAGIEHENHFGNIALNNRHAFFKIRPPQSAGNEVGRISLMSNKVVRTGLFMFDTMTGNKDQNNIISAGLTQKIK